MHMQDKWSPVHSISTILTSIQSLLTDPNVKVCMDARFGVSGLG